MSVQLDQRILEIGQVEVNTCGYKNARTILGDVTELKLAIREKGLLSPPVVWETTHKGRTHYVLLAGHRRLEAINQLRREAHEAGEEVPFEELTCSIYEGPLDGAMTAGLVDNVQRESLNPADQAEAVFKLASQIGNQEKVGHMLGKSQPWVSNYVNLYRCLIPQALNALRYEQIKVNQAKKLAMLVNQDKTPDVAAQTAELDRLLNKDEEKQEEGKEKDLPRQRAKTYRSKGEVEELRTKLAEAVQEDPDLDTQYRQYFQHFIRWFFCEVPSEEVLFSTSLDVKVSSEEPEVQVEVEAPKKKRRLADLAG
jgi:ParB/RepB/Spo0J family partition protein